MLDADLAELYGIPTKRLNEQVRRNRGRFPRDFMFRLRPQEINLMRSQIATASRRNRRHLPYAFTEHGAVMLATALSSPIAIRASIQVVRAFVRLREILLAPQDLEAPLKVIGFRP